MHRPSIGTSHERNSFGSEATETLNKHCMIIFWHPLSTQCLQFNIISSLINGNKCHLLPGNYYENAAHCGFDLTYHLQEAFKSTVTQVQERMFHQPYLAAVLLDFNDITFYYLLRPSFLIQQLTWWDLSMMVNITLSTDACADSPKMTKSKTTVWYSHDFQVLNLLGLTFYLLFTVIVEN